MKIQPIINFTYIHKQVFDSKNNLYQNIAPYGLSSDRLELSFGNGVDFEPSKIEGIHCARCGRKTLSNKKFNSISQAIMDAETGKDLIKVIEKNKEYLKKGYDFIVKDISLKTNPKISADDAIKFVLNDTGNLYSEKLDKGIDILRAAMNSSRFPQKDKECLQNCIDRIINIGPDYKQFSVHRRVLLDNFHSLEYKGKDLLYKKAFSPAERVFNFRNEMRKGNFENLSNADRKKLFAKILFDDTLAQTVPINKKAKNETAINKIVVCKSCQDRCKTTNFYFAKTDSTVQIRNNLFTYLRDINVANKGENRNLPSDYIFKVADFIAFKNPELALTSSDKGLLKFQQEYTPLPLEKLSDIPCPGCGVKMLTHDEYYMLEKEISEVSRLSGYLKIIQQRKSNINHDLYYLVNEFSRYVKENPKNSDNTIKKYFYEFATKTNHKKMKDIIKLIDLRISKNNPTESQLKDLQQLKAQFANICDFEKPIEIIDDKLISDIIKNSSVIEPLDIYNLKMPLIKINEKIRDLQYLVFPSKKMQAENKSWCEGFTKRLFKFSTFSTDHMIPRSLNGNDELHNRIGLCKKCNQNKNNLTFNEWYNNFVVNDGCFKGYLRKVKEYSDQGIIPNFETYPADIAEELFFMTNNKVDLREIYPKKKI